MHMSLLSCLSCTCVCGFVSYVSHMGMWVSECVDGVGQNLHGSQDSRGSKNIWCGSQILRGSDNWHRTKSSCLDQ